MNSLLLPARKTGMKPSLLALMRSAKESTGLSKEGRARKAVRVPEYMAGELGREL